MTDPTSPKLLLPPAPPAAPGHIDVALAALSEAAAELLASGKPSRFLELRALAEVSSMVQRLRPAAGVDDVPIDEEDQYGVPGVPVEVRRRHHHARFNDAADLNTQILMMAQSFLEKYAEIEKAKASAAPAPVPTSESRLNEVMELESLMGLRSRLSKDGDDVPREIHDRITHLLRRIAHEREPDTVVPTESVRRRPADGPGQPDGGGVGEAVAD